MNKPDAPSASKPAKKLDLNAGDLRRLDLARKYDDDFSEVDGVPWRDHLLLYTVTGLMVLFILWASLATLDEVARGDGKVIPSSEVQVIQNLEGGIVDEFLVKEGDIVKEGQIILRMRNIQAKSDFEANNKKYYGILATVMRLQAEADGKVLTYPDDVLRNAPESVSAEIASFSANRKQIDNQVDVLRSQLNQKLQEISELQRRIADISGVMKLAQDERDMVSPMVERGAAAKKELLQLDRELAQQRAELNGLKLALPRTQSAAKEAQDRINEQASSFRADAQRQLSEKTVEMNALKETLTAFKDKSQRTEISSPVQGTVKAVKFKTVGGVVKPGEPIMEIVPSEDKLLIEGRIKPADIAFIYQGQKAVVRLSAFDFSVYGSLIGEVIEISPDSITNEKGESFYRVKIRTKETKLKKGNKEMKIIPGMQATVDIITGEKTVMNYIMKPFVKAAKTAMTER
jgi:adhesin transport system membrane fusion protein